LCSIIEGHAFVFYTSSEGKAQFPELQKVKKVKILIHTQHGFLTFFSNFVFFVQLLVVNELNINDFIYFQLAKKKTVAHLVWFYSQQAFSENPLG
jgi:hypothetical protein